MGPVRPLLLPLLLLLSAIPCPGRPGGLCPPRCRCRRRVLDCSRAALPAVPPAARGRAQGALDFSGNSIFSVEEQVWKGYQWAESLFLQGNNLQAVERNSLEGLLLLKHLDLSNNQILWLDEGAFEPLPFLQLLNLGGNRITHIQNNTFKAWHGMQFLEKLILSDNPLSVIADPLLFKLPSIKYLDLSATQVTHQSLITLLLTTVSLEKLKLPSDVACCLCQKRHTTPAPCRTIEFHCQNLCTTTSSPQCAHEVPVAETPEETTESRQSRKLKPSTVFSLQPKQPSPVDHKTITTVVALSSDGDISKPNNHISRTDSYSLKYPFRNKGKNRKEMMLQHIQHMDWTNKSDLRKLHLLSKALAAEIRKKAQKSKSVMKTNISPQPAPAVQKDDVQESPALEGGLQGLNQAALDSRAAAEWLNHPTDSRHPKISAPHSEHLLLYPQEQVPYLSESAKMQNYSSAVQQTKKTPGREDVEDEGEAESAGQDYVWTPRKHKQRDTLALEKRSLLFDEIFDNVNPEEELMPMEEEEEQILNPDQQNTHSPLVTSNPPASGSEPEDMTEDESSKPEDTTEDESSEPQDTTEDEISEPEDTTEDESSEPEDTTEDEISEPEDTTEDESSKPEGTTEDESSKPEDTTEDEISEPEDTTEDESSEPQDTTEDESSEPEDTTEDESSKPEDTTEDEISEPEDTTEDEISEPEDTTEDESSKPEGTTEDESSKPEGTTEDESSKPEGTTEDESSEPEDTTEDESSEPEDTTEDDGSSLGVPATTDTSWTQQNERSRLLNKPGGSGSLDEALQQEDLFESKLHQQLLLLVPDKAVWTFIAHVAQALRTDCNLPQLQLPCIRLLAQTGLLIKLLSERQNEPGASASEDWCLQETNYSNYTPQVKEFKQLYVSIESLLALLVSFVIVIILTVICLIEACSKKTAGSSQTKSTQKSPSRWFCPNLLSWRRTKDSAREKLHLMMGLKQRCLWKLLSTQRDGAAAKMSEEEPSGEEDLSGEDELFNRYSPSTPDNPEDKRF